MKEKKKEMNVHEKFWIEIQSKIIEYITIILIKEPLAYLWRTSHWKFDL